MYVSPYLEIKDEQRQLAWLPSFCLCFLHAL